MPTVARGPIPSVERQILSYCLSAQGKPPATIHFPDYLSQNLVNRFSFVLK
jgi:hypothetical protein